MSLSDVDRQLLQRCLDRAPRAWEDFVDRFLGLVIHVANHTAESRQIQLDSSACDDLVADVFVAIIADDFGVLRRCLLYTSPSPRDRQKSRMPSSA